MTYCEPECNIAGDDCDGTISRAGGCRHWVCENHHARSEYSALDCCLECYDAYHMGIIGRFRSKLFRFMADWRRVRTVRARRS